MQEKCEKNAPRNAFFVVWHCLKVWHCLILRVWRFDIVNYFKRHQTTSNKKAAGGGERRATIFFQIFLHMSKKSSNFAAWNEKTCTMETRSFKLDVAAFLKKLQADKQALNACIREGRNVSTEAQKRGLTLATPIWYKPIICWHFVAEITQRGPQWTLTECIQCGWRSASDGTSSVASNT